MFIPEGNKRLDRGYMGIMEKKMAKIIAGYIGYRV